MGKYSERRWDRRHDLANKDRKHDLANKAWPMQSQEGCTLAREAGRAALTAQAELTSPVLLN